MIVCVEKSSGNLIESQSDGLAETLLQNAINAGYVELEVEITEVTREEFQAILDAQPTVIQPKTQLEILQETVDQLVLDALTGGT